MDIITGYNSQLEKESGAVFLIFSIHNWTIRLILSQKVCLYVDV